MNRPVPPLPPTWPTPYPRHGPASADEARGLDRDAEAAGVPSFVLMEHASLGVAALAAQMVAPGRTVVVLAGPGNNGGDGYGAARFLASWGRPVRLLRAARRPPDPAGDAGREAALAAREVAVEDLWHRPRTLAGALASAELVVDALFGVGLARDLEAPYPEWIRAVNAANALRLAVDIPSGLDADAGQPRPVAVRAHVTATMAGPKTGILAPRAGAAYAGHVVEIDIGLPGTVHGPRRLADGGLSPGDGGCGEG